MVSDVFKRIMQIALDNFGPDITTHFIYLILSFNSPEFISPQDLIGTTRCLVLCKLNMRERNITRPQRIRGS